MCGICGTLQLTDGAPPVGAGLLRRMLDSLGHRGPDDEGMYCSGGVALGHKRLKIIDLTTGKQPLSNEDGTIWIIYNGEVYNYKELTTDLVSRGHQFKTASDTEVIVHLYEEFGEDCVTKLRGMFSFALWDDNRKILLIARDRVGIKPLYYCQTEESLDVWLGNQGDPHRSFGAGRNRSCAARQLPYLLLRTGPTDLVQEHPPA